MQGLFFDEVRALLDVEVGVDDVAELEHGADTGCSQVRFGGVVRPASTGQVALIVAAANRHRVALWPVSGGRNFGYGTARPVTDGAVLLDLSRLRGVVVDKASATATIEPGVTQADLADALEAAHADLLVPTTGVGPNGNLLGNALDGGYGLTPVADHFTAISALEGVWGDGTPFGHVYDDLGCAAMSARWAWGTGPYWAGLMRQSAFGIVTRATLQLARVPEAVRILVIEWPSSERYWAAQPALARLVEEIPGIGGIIAMNDYRVLSTQADAPLAETLTGEARMAFLDALARERAISKWTAIGTLYGSRSAVAGATRDLKRRLTGCRIRAFTPAQVGVLQTLFSFLPKAVLPSLRRHLGSLANAVGTVSGTPIVAFLRIAYALQRNPLPLGLQSHPAKDGCGILWYAPLVTFDAENVARYEACMSKVLLAHGFDPLLALTTRSSRVLSATIPIIFDPLDATAVARAKVCYRALVEAGLAEGWPPYRIGTEYMEHIYPPGDSMTARLHARLKEAFDPLDIIAPGRYMRPLPASQ